MPTEVIVETPQSSPTFMVLNYQGCQKLFGLCLGKSFGEVHIFSIINCNVLFWLFMLLGIPASPHPWAEEDLSLKIDIGDQNIQICTLEL